MKIAIIEIGKTKNKALDHLVEEYRVRSTRYHPVEIINLKAAGLPKSARPQDFKRQEAERIKKVIDRDDYLILLDEKGRKFHSRGFAGYLEKKIALPKGRLVFVIGGAYGFDPEIYERADDQLALSAMTFSHQVVRLLFMEQLYRAFAIINGHPYHND